MDPDPSLLELTRTSPPAPMLRPSGLVRSALQSATQGGWVGPSLTIVMTGAISGAAAYTVVERDAAPPPQAASVAGALLAGTPLAPDTEREASTAPAVDEPREIDAFAEPPTEAPQRRHTPRAAATESTSGTPSPRVDDSLREQNPYAASDELRLVRDALDALRRSDLAAAQDAIDEHRRHFPRGILRLEREGLRCQVLVRRGDCPGAIEIARSLPYRHCERALAAHCAPAENPSPAPIAQPVIETVDIGPDDIENYRDPIRSCAMSGDAWARCILANVRPAGHRNLTALAEAYRILEDRASACRTMRTLADTYAATEYDGYLLVHCQPDARGALPPPRPSNAHLDEYFARMPNDPCAREADDGRANRCLVRTLRGDGMLELRTLALAYAALGRRTDACRTMQRYQDEYGTIGGRAFRTYVDQHCPSD